MRLIDADALIKSIPHEEIASRMAVMNAPTIEERKTGKWTERNVIYRPEASKIIEEWQSAKCAVCGKYHTTPFLYYFKDYNFCPHCGADMRGGQND